MFASAFPDPGSLELPPTVAMLFSFLVTAYALGRGAPRDDVQWKAFIGGFIGVGAGFLVWGIGLITGLY